MGMIDRIKKRRAKRRGSQKPQKQYYGGSETQAENLRGRNLAAQGASSARETAGLEGMQIERANAGSVLRNLDQRASGERSQADQDFRGLEQRAEAERVLGAKRYQAIGQEVGGERALAGSRYGQLLGNVQGQRRKNALQSTIYGLGADQSLQDYRSGRGAILGGAGEIEALGRAAPAVYQSAADAAFNAAAARNQRSALSLAAGRGNDAVRTAIAAAAGGNRQAMLEQQVTGAQEANELLKMQQGALESAANIRSGVGAADQGAAGIQAGRQQVATGATNQLLGMEGDVVGADTATGLQAAGLRKDIATADANLGTTTTAQRAGLAEANAQTGLAANAQRAGIATTDAQLGIGTQEAVANAGAAREGRYLGAETAQETAQLGANTDYEAARLAKATDAGKKRFKTLFLDPAGLFG